MSQISNKNFQLPPEQQAIWDKCFHPSATFIEFPLEDVETTIPKRFEKIARMYPDRIAVTTPEQAVTYADLNAMANRLAHALEKERGTEAERIVVMFENGANLVAAILGILKVGKSIVLVDPALPKSRLLTLIQDSEAAVLVADEKTVSLGAELSSLPCRLITLDEIDSNLSQHNLNLHVDANAMAFIFYTSGSTGSPKGVIGTHRNFLHNIMLRTNGYRVCREDRFSLLASGTSNAILTTFLPVLNGAALAPFNIATLGTAPLVNWLAAEAITVCWISSPLFRALCENLTDRNNFSALRLVRLSSETTSKKDVDLFKNLFSPPTILSTGISTTESGYLTRYLIDQTLEIHGDSVPLGYGVRDKEILLVDDEGKQLGVNEVGEIVVKSQYLSPGYWRRPDLTNAQFEADPEGGDKRLHHTGDLGLLLSDGCLLYKGRKDFRVKIRGFGVEIAEVEKVILRYEGVRETVVVALQNDQGEARLVAYFTVLELKPTVSALRGFLKERLPAYMIPSVLVILDAIPIGPNGKVDRRALPDPTRSRADLPTAFVAPHNSTQAKLERIWAEVLFLDRVGIHDNFFDLGGHSLAASSVISRVIKSFQLELPVKALFDAPTIAEMAKVILGNDAKRATEENLKLGLDEIEAMTEEEADRQLAEKK